MVARVAFRLATVPPEALPFMWRTRPFTRGAGMPKRAFAASCSVQTPRSKEMESNPQENTMRAPVLLAVASCASIISRIHNGSPHRST